MLPDTDEQVIAGQTRSAPVDVERERFFAYRARNPRASGPDRHSVPVCLSTTSMTGSKLRFV